MQSGKPQDSRPAAHLQLGEHSGLLNNVHAGLVQRQAMLRAAAAVRLAWVCGPPDHEAELVVRAAWISACNQCAYGPRQIATPAELKHRLAPLDLRYDASSQLVDRICAVRMSIRVHF